MTDPDTSATTSAPPPFTADAVRAAYNGAAARYAELFADPLLRDHPVERGLLAAFAELVRAGGGRPVADLGCGPGYLTAHLSSLGLAAFGVDLSPAMIDLARAAHPELRFEVGSMDALGSLGIADGSLGGVLSRYSIIHLSAERLSAVVAEFGRVLAPGGHLLVSFGAAEAEQDGAPGGDHTFYDHSVTGAHCWRPDYVSALLLQVGLVERERLLTRPEPAAKRQFSSVQLLARKAGG
ncbi:MAG TPA: class I SAM-dependent methyltransferase [Actinocrinis sp.]|nr:class I SAM-dependent methyltransferase [Actinocrinis sp.]